MMLADQLEEGGDRGDLATGLTHSLLSVGVAPKFQVGDLTLYHPMPSCNT